MLRRLAAAIFVLVAPLLCLPAHAQQLGGAWTVATCGTPPNGFGTSGVGYKAGANYPLTQDTTGTLCTASGGGGGGSNAAAGPTGAAVPADGSYTAFNVGGLLAGWKGDAQGGGLVAGEGVAGTPAGGVLTVQGVSGGTGIPVSGTVAATQSGTWTVGLSAGANTIGAISNTSFGATQATASNLNAQVVGNIASLASDSGNPIKIGGVYSATSLPAPTAGQRVDAQATSDGSIRVGLSSTFLSLKTGLGVNVAVPYQQGMTTGIPLGIAEFLYNGSSQDASVSINGYSPGAGTGAKAVAEVPHTTNGTAGSATATAASSLVLKSSAGNLYSFDVVAGASAGYLMLFDATSAPADGTVTPKWCLPLAANQGFSAANTPIPMQFSTGITAVFSTTGCFTKTASATAYISGQVQ